MLLAVVVDSGMLNLNVCKVQSVGGCIRNVVGHDPCTEVARLLLPSHFCAAFPPSPSPAMDIVGPFGMAAIDGLSRNYPRSRDWCGTWNLAADVEDDAGADVVMPPTVRYAVWQRERGASSGHDHLQMYVEFNGPATFTAVRSAFPGVHWARRRGTRRQARDYCMKRDATYVAGPWEHGEWHPDGQGARSDLADAVDIAVNCGMAAVAAEQPVQFVKFERGLRSLVATTVRPRSQPCEVRIHCGAADAGKTRWAYETYPGEVYPKDPSNHWWDGYTGQRCVLIDEFYGKGMEFSYLQRLLDRYPMPLQIKGGFVPFAATTQCIVITSNDMWTDWYPQFSSPAILRSFQRRITHDVLYPSNDDGVGVGGECVPLAMNGPDIAGVPAADFYGDPLYRPYTPATPCRTRTVVSPAPSVAAESSGATRLTPSPTPLDALSDILLGEPAPRSRAVPWVLYGPPPRLPSARDGDLLPGEEPLLGPH